MATGRIGVTPTLRTRWSKLPTAGTTVLSGLDDNSVALVYDAGYEAVYRNGVLLSRGNDYTATNGTTVTLVDATLAGDIIEIFANDLVPLTDAISKGQYNAKGALLSATAASTPAVLPVGTNGQVLTAASGESTGLQWATVSSGGMTLLSTTTMNSPTVTVSSISQAYNRIFVEYIGVQQATTGNTIDILLDNSTVASYTGVLDGGIEENNNDYIKLTLRQAAALNTQMNWSLTVDNYTSTTTYKPFMIYGMGVRLTSTKDTKIIYGGVMKSNSAFDSVTIQSDNGTSNLTGTIKVWGIK